MTVSTLPTCGLSSSTALGPTLNLTFAFHSKTDQLVILINQTKKEEDSRVSYFPSYAKQSQGTIPSVSENRISAQLRAPSSSNYHQEPSILDSRTRCRFLNQHLLPRTLNLECTGLTRWVEPSFRKPQAIGCATARRSPLSLHKSNVENPRKESTPNFEAWSRSDQSRAEGSCVSSAHAFCELRDRRKASKRLEAKSYRFCCRRRGRIHSSKKKKIPCVLHDQNEDRGFARRVRHSTYTGTNIMHQASNRDPG
ncbi:hypothetical protein BKA70DRAFT_459520 [Coprinopsis sp. MPI-PUGE-AT-0042]|nr:hypothetical protein BKA70DRAFT_459520 [Coprinopsis sp. MPI-PUGE-AT-0042]